ncbi:MAG: outer membrane beta-barrel protein [Pseudomonadota bacterium]
MALTASLSLALPAAVQSQAFDGAYVGVQTGFSDVDATGGSEGEEAMIGAHAGINFSAGSFVYGAEIGFDSLDTDLAEGAGELDSVTRLRARGGYAIGNGLIFGSAGVAFGDASDIGDDTGFFVGVGAEFDTIGQGSVGVEYLHTEFDEFDGSGIDVDIDSFSVRYSYNF